MRNVFVEAGCHNNWAATAGSSWSRAMNQEPPAPTASTTVKSAAQIPVHSRKPHRAVYNLQPEHALMITKVFKCFRIHAIWCNTIDSFKRHNVSMCGKSAIIDFFHLAFLATFFCNQSLVHLLYLRKLCTERSAQAPIWPWVWPQYQLIELILTTQESTSMDKIRTCFHQQVNTLSESFWTQINLKHLWPYQHVPNKDVSKSNGV